VRRRRTLVFWVPRRSFVSLLPSLLSCAYVLSRRSPPTHAAIGGSARTSSTHRAQGCAEGSELSRLPGEFVDARQRIGADKLPNNVGLVVFSAGPNLGLDFPIKYFPALFDVRESTFSSRRSLPKKSTCSLISSGRDSAPKASASANISLSTCSALAPFEINLAGRRRCHLACSEHVCR
jgi:hypothetical protein